MNVKPAKILVVDDEQIVRINLEKLLTKQGYEIVTTDSGERALELLKEQEFNLALVDLVLQGMDGLELLERIKRKSPETIVIILTGYGSMKSAIEALRKGAFDYILKTYDEDDEMNFRIMRGLERQSFGRQLKQQLLEKERLKAITELAVTCNDQINSPLGVILGNIELLKINMPAMSESIRHTFEVIEMEIRKIEEIMSSLTRIAKPVIREYGLGKYTMIDISKSEMKKTSARAAAAKDKKVLLVDDDNLMVDLMANMIEEIGCKPLVAYEGNQALELFRKENVQLVVSDINMPGMNGIDLMEKMKAEKPKVPVMLITGFGKEDAAQVARAKGADGFLGKPFNFADFRDMVERLT